MEECVMHRLGNVLAACAIVSSGCATDRYASTGTAYLNPFAGSGDVGVSVASTGREGYDTPSGEFRITQKDVDRASNLYGDYVDPSGHVVMRNVNIKLDPDPQPPGTTFRGAPMPYFLRIQGGIGMHAGYLPGYPASHGCIRLPERRAVRFFQNAACRYSCSGTPVEIIKS
jgi:lipoprotein-anchoring transpeptidase ErfK/SrfK